jgi:hypothetical protein
MTKERSLHARITLNKLKSVFHNKRRENEERTLISWLNFKYSFYRFLGTISWLYDCTWIGVERDSKSWFPRTSISWLLSRQRLSGEEKFSKQWMLIPWEDRDQREQHNIRSTRKRTLKRNSWSKFMRRILITVSETRATSQQLWDKATLIHERVIQLHSKIIQRTKVPKTKINIKRGRGDHG